MKKVTFPAFFTFVFISLFSVLSCQNQDDDILQNAWNNRPQQYSVVFNSNGGSGSMPVLETTEIVGKTLTANSFARSGYVFDGWNTASDGTGSNFADGAALSTVFGSTGVVVTLYAKWTPCYTITFDSNNGTGEVAEQSFISGESHALIKNGFTKTGYGFRGWAFTKDADSALYSDEEVISVSSSFTLYAVWSLDVYTVTFNSNYGTHEIYTQNFLYGENKKLLTNTFTRKGYSFSGWGLSPESVSPVYSDGESVDFTSDTLLYALWTINKYTLTFYPNGASGSSYMRVVDYDTIETVDACVFTAQTGYYFDSWNTQPDGSGESFSASSQFNMPDFPVDLYAIWQEKPAHSITYHNTLDAENTNPAEYKEKDSVSLIDLTLKNYKFDGWYINDTGIQLTGWNPGTYQTDLDLYAHWTYPDEVKGENGKFGYACGDISLTYTVTITSSKGGYSKSFTFHSGESVNTMTITNIPTAAVADGVVWTTNVVAVNTEHNLRYEGTSTTTIKNQDLQITIPVLERINQE